MVALIGNYGQLIQFKCPSSLSVAPASRSSYRVTNKGRVVEFRGPRGRREWSVDIGSATPSEVAGLASLVDGLFGRPPWVWVDPWAVTTNLLSPDAAALADGTFNGSGFSLGGAGFTTDGLPFGRSVIIQAGGFAALGLRKSQTDHVPVIPGEPFTASIYASGTGYLRVDFFNSAGTYLSTATGATASGVWTRRTVTMPTAPDNAARAQLRAVATTTTLAVTLPTPTWTTSAQPWAHGAGCNRVTVDGLAQAVQWAVRGEPGMQRASTSFIVKELG